MWASSCLQAFPKGATILPLVATADDKSAEGEQLASLFWQGTRWGVSGHNSVMLLCVITAEIQIRAIALQYLGLCITTPSEAVMGVGVKGDVGFLMQIKYSAYINANFLRNMCLVNLYRERC